jgi:hypothetical protein
MQPPSCSCAPALDGKGVPLTAPPPPPASVASNWACSGRDGRGPTALGSTFGCPLPFGQQHVIQHFVHGLPGRPATTIRVVDSVWGASRARLSHDRQKHNNYTFTQHKTPQKVSSRRSSQVPSGGICANAVAHQETELHKVCRPSLPPLSIHPTTPEGSAVACPVSALFLAEPGAQTETHQRMVHCDRAPGSLPKLALCSVRSPCSCRPLPSPPEQGVARRRSLPPPTKRPNRRSPHLVSAPSRSRSSHATPPDAGQGMKADRSLSSSQCRSCRRLASRASPLDAAEHSPRPRSEAHRRR